MFERNDEETRPRANPRTMLCELSSVEVLASEPTGGLMFVDASLSSTVATVEVDESGSIWGGGDSGRGVVSSMRVMGTSFVSV